MKKKTILLSVAPILMAAASLTSCGGSHPDDPIGPLEPVCFTAKNDNSIIAGCFAVGEDGKKPAKLPEIYYYIGEKPSTNPKDWTEFVMDNPIYSDEEGYQVIATLNEGQKIYFVGKNPDGINGRKVGADPDEAIVYWHFGTAKHEKDDEHGFDISGNIMSLIDYTKEIKKIPNPYCFAYLFANRIWGGPQFIDASGLTLGSQSSNIELTEGCYYGMFYNDQYLVKAPTTLPRKILTPYCYSEMFSSCANLVEAPKVLPATSLAPHCYEKMFLNCYYALKKAPELPANTSQINNAEGCYNYMFYNCHFLNELTVGFGETGSQQWPGEEKTEHGISYYTNLWLNGAGILAEGHKATFTWKGSDQGPEHRSVHSIPEDSYDCEWNIQSK